MTQCWRCGCFDPMTLRHKCVQTFQAVHKVSKPHGLIMQIGSVSRIFIACRTGWESTLFSVVMYDASPDLVATTCKMAIDFFVQVCCVTGLQIMICSLGV